MKGHDFVEAKRKDRRSPGMQSVLPLSMRVRTVGMDNVLAVHKCSINQLFSMCNSCLKLSQSGASE